MNHQPSQRHLVLQQDRHHNRVSMEMFVLDSYDCQFYPPRHCLLCIRVPPLIPSTAPPMKPPIVGFQASLFSLRFAETSRANVYDPPTAPIVSNYEKSASIHYFVHRRTPMSVSSISYQTWQLHHHFSWIHPRNHSFVSLERFVLLRWRHRLMHQLHRLVNLCQRHHQAWKTPLARVEEPLPVLLHSRTELWKQASG